MAETQEFTIGQMVRVKRLWPTNHHRVPYYLKGKIGQVATCLGPVENPELNAYFNKSSGHIFYRVVSMRNVGRQSLTKSTPILRENGSVRRRADDGRPS